MMCEKCAGLTEECERCNGEGELCDWCNEPISECLCAVEALNNGESPYGK